MSWLRSLPPRQRLHALERRLQGLRGELVLTRNALLLAQAHAQTAQSVGQHDPLTGLSNRAGFETETRLTLARHMQCRQLYALLFIDLDGFKAVNDNLGHEAGDALLRIVGARLAHAMRGGDTISRHGGDEFLCLLPDLQSKTRATAIAEELVRTVSAPCAIGSTQVCVRASIGVAFFPQDGANLPELMHRADQAMYQAKRSHSGVALAGPTH